MSKYAFPFVIPEGVCEGMELRDYFAAHAPEVPDWFKQPNEPAIEDMMSDTYREDYAKWHIKRYFSWRWYYADQMLKAREESK